MNNATEAETSDPFNDLFDYFRPEQNTIIRIRFNLVIEYFELALKSRRPANIMPIWEKNPQLAAYFNGETITLFNAQGQEKPIRISLEDLITYFRLALKSQYSAVIKSMWESNSELETYYKGEAIEERNQQGQVEKSIRITFKGLVADFKTVLASQCSHVINSIWMINIHLGAYLTGKRIGLISKQGQTETVTIPFMDLIAFFRAALPSQSSLVVQSMWENNPQLVAYFSGQAIEENNEQGEKKIFKLSFPQLIQHFRSILASRNKTVIESMWKHNPQFAAYFRGEAIEGSDETGQQKIFQLSPQNVLHNFKSTLSSNVSFVIDNIWNKNSLLQDEIKKLDDNKLKDLINKVLSSSRVGYSDFITNFLNFISNKPILEELLNSRMTLEKQTTYTKHQINSLTRRLAAIDSSSAPLSIDAEGQPPHNANSQYEMTTDSSNPGLVVNQGMFKIRRTGSTENASAYGLDNPEQQTPEGRRKR